MLGFLKKIFGGGDDKDTQAKTPTNTKTNESSPASNIASSLKMEDNSQARQQNANSVKSGEISHQLDCKNMNCPMPIVMISKKIKTINIGEVLEVTATDPAFIADVRAWSRKTGNELLSHDDNSAIKIALVRKLVDI